MARSFAKRFFGSLLFVLAAVATLAFVFLLYADSINDDSVPFADKTKDAGLVIAIVLGVICLALLVMLLTRRWSAQEEVAEQAEVFFIPEAPPVQRAVPTGTTEFTAAPEITIYDLAKVPTAGKSWSAPEVDGKQHPFYFPRSVTGGIYVNDYVPIDNQFKLLKLRTLLGGPYDPAFTDTKGPRSAARAAPAAATAAYAPPAAPVASSPVVLQEVTAESLLANQQELEAAEAAAPAASGVFVDYPGDNHEVEDLEGIGPTYGKRLRDAGVHTTARLSYEDTGRLAEAVQVPRGTVEAWKQMAELVKVKGIGPQYAEALVRAGITGIADLKRRSPARMAQQVNDYLNTLETNVLGNKVTEKRVEGWKEAARTMKKVRLQVPER